VPVLQTTSPSPGSPIDTALGRREVLTLRPPSRARGTHWVRVHRAAMACRFEITLSDLDYRHVSSAHEALAEADRLESAWTLFRDSSDLMALNRRAGFEAVHVDAELFTLLCRCRDLHAATEAAFDVTSTPLSQCWGFLRRQGRVPSFQEIVKALELAGMDGIELDQTASTVKFRRPGMAINLGSIGKGFAVAAIAARLRARGVRHALVSAGASSIVALGGRGSGWSIDLHSRQAQRGRLARLWLRDGAMGTSGAGEQFVEVDGTRHGHVLDPRTGWPARGVLSATVVTTDGATADALATAFLIGGADLARRYCQTHPETLVLLTPDDASERPIRIGHYAGAQVEGPVCDVAVAQAREERL
jgi:thiamine biosynthesis lipoprotein